MYVYEIQLTGAVQRCGLGQHLMGLAELLACRVHMPKLMLTVFKANRAATFFYLGKLRCVSMVVLGSILRAGRARLHGSLVLCCALRCFSW